MAGSYGDSFENECLNVVVGRAAITQKTVYLALYTVPPTDAGGGTECTGGAYARVQLNTPPSTNTYFGSAASGGQIANTATITFPTPTAAWGTVVAFGILDASTAGNLLAWSTLPAQQVNANDTVDFPVGSIVLSMD